jgi:hypothetical protein
MYKVRTVYCVCIKLLVIILMILDTLNIVLNPDDTKDPIFPSQ